MLWRILVRKKLMRFGWRLLLSRFNSSPVFMHIAPTQACNLKCRYCFQREENFEMMSWNLFLQVLEQAKDLGIAVISFTGGEPLVWPHLTEAVRVCTKKNMITEVTTNGFLLSRSKIEELAEAGLDYMIVSIDSVNKTSQSQKSLSENPNLLGYMKYAQYKGILVSVNCVLGRENAKQLPYLVQLLSKAGIFISIGFLDLPPILSKEVLKTKDYSLSFSNKDKKALLDIIDQIVGMKRSGMLIIEPEAYFLKYPLHLQGEKVWDCRKSKIYSLQVTPDGRLFKCTRLGPSSYDFVGLDKKRLERFKEELFKIISECNKRCYCNCSFNNYYYRSHLVEFVSRVLYPALREFKKSGEKRLTEMEKRA